MILHGVDNNDKPQQFALDRKKILRSSYVRTSWSLTEKDLTALSLRPRTKEIRLKVNDVTSI